MDINKYFDEVQECIKSLVVKPHELNSIIKELDKDNLQAIINQNFNGNVSVDETAKQILDSIDEHLIEPNAPDTLGGERTLNKMEKNVMNFKDFLNESLEDTEYIIVDTNPEPTNYSPLYYYDVSSNSFFAELPFATFFKTKERADLLLKKAQKKYPKKELKVMPSEE